MRAEVFKEEEVEIIVAMVPTPCGFLEMKNEVIGADAAQFGEAQCGEAPEAFDPVDVVFAAGEFVLMMVNTMVFVTPEDEAIVGLPAVGRDRGGGGALGP